MINYISTRYCVQFVDETLTLPKIWNYATRYTTHKLLPIPEIMNLDDEGEITLKPYYATLAFLTVGSFSLEDLRHKDKDENYYKNLQKWIRDVELGLQLAHQARIIHDDVEPGNIVVVEKENRAILIDWDMAVRMQGKSTVGNLFYRSLRRLRKLKKQPLAKYYPVPADDFESLFYTYLDLVVPELDWRLANTKNAFDIKSSVILRFEECVDEWKSSYPKVPDTIWNDLVKMYQILFPTNNFKDDPEVCGIFVEPE